MRLEIFALLVFSFFLFIIIQKQFDVVCETKKKRAPVSEWPMCVSNDDIIFFKLYAFFKAHLPNVDWNFNCGRERESLKCLRMS